MRKRNGVAGHSTDRVILIPLTWPQDAQTTVGRLSETRTEEKKQFCTTIIRNAYDILEEGMEV